MLGDCVNSYTKADLNRFYLSTMAGYYPEERNAFDTARKKCHKRKLRGAQSANTLLFVCVADYDPTEYGAGTDSNVVDISVRKQNLDTKVEPIVITRRQLTWKALYQRESA